MPTPQLTTHHAQWIEGPSLTTLQVCTGKNSPSGISYTVCMPCHSMYTQCHGGQPQTHILLLYCHGGYHSVTSLSSHIILYTVRVTHNTSTHTHPHTLTPGWGRPVPSSQRGGRTLWVPGSRACLVCNQAPHSLARNKTTGLPTLFCR